MVGYGQASSADSLSCFGYPAASCSLDAGLAFPSEVWTSRPCLGSDGKGPKALRKPNAKGPSTKPLKLEGRRTHLTSIGRPLLKPVLRSSPARHARRVFKRGPRRGPRRRKDQNLPCRTSSSGCFRFSSVGLFVFKFSSDLRNLVFSKVPFFEILVFLLEIASLFWASAITLVPSERFCPCLQTFFVSRAIFFFPVIVSSSFRAVAQILESFSSRLLRPLMGYRTGWFLFSSPPVSFEIILSFSSVCPLSSLDLFEQCAPNCPVYYNVFSSDFFSNRLLFVFRIL